MPSLSSLQKKNLLKIEPHTNAVKMAGYILKFDNISLDDFPNMAPDKRAKIQEIIASHPDPVEQQEWNEISVAESGLPSIDSPEALLAYKNLYNSIDAYIQHWEQSRPKDNHVDEAIAKKSGLEAMLQKIEGQKEVIEWGSVDQNSIDSLLNHLQKYENSQHRDEIDDRVWQLTDKTDIPAVKSYINRFPGGRHNAEAQTVIDDASIIEETIGEWNNVKRTNDIFQVSDFYWKKLSSPSNPLHNDAAAFLSQLRKKEIEDMHNSPNSYSVSRLIELVNKGIFSDKELIDENVTTQRILNDLRNNSNMEDDLPDVNQAVANSEASCHDGYTDIYFFGIPSTGKTCVLMGLSRTKSLNINLASGGGDYAQVLQLYTEAGVTMPPTQNTFVTTLEATVSSKVTPDAVHKINLVEMSGEEFAFQIVNNPNHKFSFEDMGSGATELLKNDNRKVFFLIIDPTAGNVKFNREIIDEYDEETGAPLISHLQSSVVNQRIVLQKMVNLFELPQNADIMQKVDAIHIIMTKADLLGSPTERNQKALEKFNNDYSGDILEPLQRLCRKYNIDSNTDNTPRLYTFSLGTFYVGGRYEYDPTDSENLVNAICNYTRSVGGKVSFTQSLKSKF